MQLQMNELGESRRTEFAAEWLFPAVQALMRLQIAGAGEALAADLTFMRPLSCVHQMVFLQVCQLSETFAANGACEGPLARVHAQMYLEVGELAECFSTHRALVGHATLSTSESGWLRGGGLKLRLRWLWWGCCWLWWLKRCGRGEDWISESQEIPHPEIKGNHGGTWWTGF